MFNSCILHPDDTGIPQGSVLGLIPFSIYTRLLDSLIQIHGFSISLPCRQKSGLLFMSLSVFTSVILYPSDISTWMNNQHLELNLSRLSCSQDGFWLSSTAPYISAKMISWHSVNTSQQSHRLMALWRTTQEFFFFSWPQRLVKLFSPDRGGRDYSPDPKPQVDTNCFKWCLDVSPMIFSCLCRWELKVLQD